MNIDQYRTAVEALANEKPNKRFSNKGAQHAAVVVEQIFRGATDTVRVFSGSLSSDIYLQEPVKASIQQFLQRPNTSLWVITQTAIDPATEAFIRRIATEGRVVVVSAPESARELGNHFMVADGRAYRFEVDGKNREAVVNFNEPGIATALAASFDSATAQKA